MGRKILPAGKLTYAQKRAIHRAATYNGPNRVEKLYGCIIKYTDDKAFIVPLELSDYGWASLPNPVPYRTMLLTARNIGKYPYGTFDSTQTPVITTTLSNGNTGNEANNTATSTYYDNSITKFFNSSGKLIQEVTSIVDGVVFNVKTNGVWGAPGSYSTYKYTNWGVGGAIGNVWNGVYKWVKYTWGDQFTLVSEPVTTLNFGGEILKNIFENDISSGIAGYFAGAFLSGKTLLVQTRLEVKMDGTGGEVLESVSWSGGDSFDVVKKDGSSRTISIPNIPEDCIYTTAGENIGGDYGDQTAKARRKAWFAKNSIATIDKLKTGIIPFEWERLIPAANYYKRRISFAHGAPRKTDLKIEFNDVYLVDNPLVSVVQRTVKFSYSIGEEIISDTVVGTQKTESIKHVTKSDRTSYSYVITYNNWCNYELWNIKSEIVIVFNEDIFYPNISNISLMLNGIEIRGYDDDSSNGSPNISVDWNGGWEECTPPFPKTEVNLVSTIAPIVKKYLDDVPFKGGAYAKDIESRVRLTPVAWIINGELVGMFAEAGLVNAVEVYGSAELIYNTTTRRFDFVQWKPLANGAESQRIETDVVFGNCVIEYLDPYLPDTADAAEKDNKARATSDDPYDKLMNEILLAVKGGATP